MMPEAAPPTAAHDPVLLTEILEFLFPAGPAAGGFFCDATLGMGGHSQAILESSGPTGHLLGLDRDPDALAFAGARLAPFGDRVTLVHAPFSQLAATLASRGLGPPTGVLADLGVSSPQLDRAERGFSFQRTGPLDMRMDQTTGESAAELVGRLDERELAGILRDLGEERFAGRIARRIVEARERGPLDTTGALAEVVAQAVPARERHKNPATRTFQALRLAVNRELDELGTNQTKTPNQQKPGGRLCIISFHSLEDRMVMRRFRARAGPRPGGPGGAPK